MCLEEVAAIKLVAYLDLDLIMKQRQRWPYLQDSARLRKQKDFLFPVQIITVEHLT